MTLLRPVARRHGGDDLARVAVRIEKAEARAAPEVGAHEIGEQSGLAGAGLAGNVDMAAAVGLRQRHALASGERAEDVWMVRVHKPASSRAECSCRWYELRSVPVVGALNAVARAKSCPPIHYTCGTVRASSSCR